MSKKETLPRIHSLSPKFKDNMCDTKPNERTPDFKQKSKPAWLNVSSAKGMKRKHLEEERKRKMEEENPKDTSKKEKKDNSL